MLERFEKSDGLGAIYPGILNSIIALKCLGYSNDDPQVIRALDEFEKLGIDEPELPIILKQRSACSLACPRCGTRLMPFMPWVNPGLRKKDPRMIKAADWILSKEVRSKGDWAVKVKNCQPGRMVLRVQQRVLSRRG